MIERHSDLFERLDYLFPVNILQSNPSVPRLDQSGIRTRGKRMPGDRPCVNIEETDSKIPRIFVAADPRDKQMSSAFPVNAN